MPLFFLAPILALLTNNFVLTVPVRSYVLHRFPYFIAMSIAYGILNYPTPYMRAFQMWTGLFPAFIHATWIALRSRKKKPFYQVNAKPVEKVKRKNPWPATLPQQGIIYLSIFSVIFTFLRGVPQWDFYLLNIVWIMWSIWTMSGICLAAVKKHRWPKETALETGIAPSFFSRTRELIFTVALSVLITLFFATADMSKVSDSLTDLRSRILSASHFRPSVLTLPKETMRVVEVSKPSPEEKSERTESLSSGVLSLEQKEEAGKTERVAKEEEKLKKEGIRQKDYWTLQVVSVKTEEEAMVYKERLMAAGFPAFSLTAKVKRENWIRVRLGFFSSMEEVQRTAVAVKKRLMFSEPYWISKISKGELEALLGE
jgi:hypothetical protein